MSTPLKTPLLYGEAVDLVIAAAPDVTVTALAALVSVLLTVDQSSRDQSGAKELLTALKSIRYELDNDCPLTAQQIAEAAILVADPESEPIENVVARINAAGELYLNSPNDGYAMPKEEK